MKVLVRGNTCIIQTDIKEEDFNKFKKFDAFTVRDNEDNVVYVLSRGAVGNINDFSMTCNSVYQDKLALSLVFEEPQAEFLEELKPALVSLKEAEAYMHADMVAIHDMLATVEEDITVE